MIFSGIAAEYLTKAVLCRGAEDAGKILLRQVDCYTNLTAWTCMPVFEEYDFFTTLTAWTCKHVFEEYRLYVCVRLPLHAQLEFCCGS